MTRGVVVPTRNFYVVFIVCVFKMLNCLFSIINEGINSKVAEFECRLRLRCVRCEERMETLERCFLCDQPATTTCTRCGEVRRDTVTVCNIVMLYVQLNKVTALYDRAVTVPEKAPTSLVSIDPPVSYGLCGQGTSVTF